MTTRPVRRQGRSPSMTSAREQRRMNGGMTDAEIDAHAEEMERLWTAISDEWRRRDVKTLGDAFQVIADLDPDWGNR